MAPAIPDRGARPRYPADNSQRWMYPPNYVRNSDNPEDPRAIQYLLAAMVIKVKEYLAIPRDPPLSVEDLIVTRVGKHSLKSDNDYSRIESVVVQIYKKYFRFIFGGNTEQVGTMLRLREYQEPEKRADLMVLVAAATQLVLRFMEESVDHSAATSSTTEEPVIRPVREHPLIVVSLDDWRTNVMSMAVTPATPMGLAPTQDVVPLIAPAPDQAQLDFEEREDTWQSRMDGNRAQMLQANRRIEIQNEAIASQRQSITELQAMVRQLLDRDDSGSRPTRTRTHSEAFPELAQATPANQGNPPTAQGIPGYAPHVTQEMLDRRDDTDGIKPSQYGRKYFNANIANKIKYNQPITANMLFSASTGGTSNTSIDVQAGESGGISFVTSNNTRSKVTAFQNFVLVERVLHDNLCAVGDLLSARQVRDELSYNIAQAYAYSGDIIGAVVHYFDSFIPTFIDMRHRGLKCDLTYDGNLMQESMCWYNRHKAMTTRNQNQGQSARSGNQSAFKPRGPRIVDQKDASAFASIDCLNWQAGRDCATRIGHANGPCPMRHTGEKGANPSALYNRPKLNSSGNPAASRQA